MRKSLTPKFWVAKPIWNKYYASNNDVKFFNLDLSQN